MPSEPRCYQCERCGGTGQVIAGCWNPATEKYDSPAGVCDHCGGSGELGVIEPSLDALLAIVRRRTPGEWQIRHGVGIGRTTGCESHHIKFGSSTVVFTHAHDLTDQDAAAIVAAVNNFESVAERCKRADAARWATNPSWLELTRQRDELLAALRFTEDYSLRTNQPSLTRQVRLVLSSVKGGAD